MTGVVHMLSHPFLVHAITAGTAIALVSGLVGYFVVLRGQVFVGDALSHVAYAGALAALAAGVDLRLGLFAATITVGLVIGALGGRGPADDVVIGTVFAWVLGLGVFFLAYYTTYGSGGDGAASVRVLFGSIYGIGSGAATLAVVVAVILIVALLAMARPLLFASIDPVVAAARGVPVRVHRTRVPGRGRRQRGRGQSGRRRPAAVRPARRSGRGRAAPDRPAMAGVRPVRAAGRAGHVGRPRPGVRLPGPSAELHDHGRGHGRIRPGRSGRRPGQECSGHSPNTSRVWLTSV